MKNYVVYVTDTNYREIQADEFDVREGYLWFYVNDETVAGFAPGWIFVIEQKPAK